MVKRCFIADFGSEWLSVRWLCDPTVCDTKHNKLEMRGGIEMLMMSLMEKLTGLTHIWLLPANLWTRT